MKLIVKQTVYRKGEGIISNISNPTFDVYECNDEGLTLIEIIEGKGMKFIGREGPEIKEEETFG